VCFDGHKRLRGSNLMEASGSLCEGGAGEAAPAPLERHGSLAGRP
jgi:hypothetical protein